MPESRVANGTITPSTFVVLDTTAGNNGKVLAASGTSVPIFGIAQKGTRYAPFPGLDDGNAALAGEDLMVYTNPDKEVYLSIGSGGCKPGDRLTSDGSGNGIVTTTTGQWVGAEARGTANANDLCPVNPVTSYEY